MSKFRRGFRQPTDMTKGEIVRSYDDRLKALSNAIQQVLALTSRQTGAINQTLQNVAEQLEKADYRSLATMKMLAEKGVLTVEAHEEYTENLKIGEFNEQSAKDDLLRRLTLVQGPAKLGHVATVRIKAFNGPNLLVPSIKDATSLTGVNGQQVTDKVPTPLEVIPNPNAGKPIDQLSALRSKVEVGSGQLHPVIEKEFVGMNVGETKEFTLNMPPEFKAFAGQEVKFEVQLFDLKELPPASVVAPEAKTDQISETNAQEEVQV